jgi:hypothetical protein
MLAHMAVSYLTRDIIPGVRRALLTIHVSHTNDRKATQRPSMIMITILQSVRHWFSGPAYHCVSYTFGRHSCVARQQPAYAEVCSS